MFRIVGPNVPVTPGAARATDQNTGTCMRVAVGTLPPTATSTASRSLLYCSNNPPGLAVGTLPKCL